MIESKFESKYENLESETMGKVQMSIRLEEELRDELKIHAIQNKIKINDLLVKYLQEGLERDTMTPPTQ